MEIEYKKIYYGDLYEVEYEVTGYWNDGYNVVIKIKNNSDNCIQNWFLEMDSEENVEDIYNARMELIHEKTYYVGLEWNQDIEVNQVVRFGYTVHSSYSGPPKYCLVYFGKELVDEETFEVSFDKNPIWENGYTGYLTITNRSEYEIIDWMMEFNFEEEIAEIWNASIVSHEKNSYVLSNAGYSKNILPNSQITIGFNVRNCSGNHVPSSILLYKGTYPCTNDNSFLSTDSDEDGLPDFYEEHITFTDSFNPKTDGIYMDGDRDEDQDGLPNLEEYSLLSNALLSDTDYDGLLDFDEVYVYFTNPCEYDTDFDGVGDWTEVMRGTNPLVTDSDDNGVADGDEIITFPLCDNEYYALNPDEMGYSVQIEITGRGDFNDKINLQQGVQHASFPEIDYLLGEPLYIEHEEIEFEKTTMTFTLSDKLIEQCAVSNIGIASFDEKTNIIEFCDTEIVSTNQIRCVTTHFSYYFLVDLERLKLYFSGPAIDKKKTICDVAFVVDTTGSMSYGINNTVNTLSKISDLTNELGMDVRYGLIEYKDLSEDSFPSKDYGWFDDSEDFKKKIAQFTSDGGGDWEESAVDALETARISSFRKYANKSIVLITDAPYKENTNYDNLSSMEEEIRRLTLSGITVYVITESECEEYYSDLVNKTGGREYNIYADYAVSLIELFTNENNKAKEYNWVRLTDGTIVKLLVDPEKATRDNQIDTDKDGIPDMKELTLKTTIICGGDSYVVWGYNTNPAIHNDLYEYESKYRSKGSAYTVYELYEIVKKIEAVYASATIRELVKEGNSIIISNNDFDQIYRYLSNSSILYFLGQKNYSDTKWKILEGENNRSAFVRKKIEKYDSLVDSDRNTIIFTNEVAEKALGDNAELSEYRTLEMVDAVERINVDFTHFAASCNAHYNQDSFVAGWPIELASWGGDLQTFSIDMFGEKDEINNYQEVYRVFNSKIGDDSTTFSMDDLIADIDAINISEMLPNQTLSCIVKEYYVEKGAFQRFSKFLEHYNGDIFKELDTILPVDSFSDYKTNPRWSLESNLIVERTAIPFVYRDALMYNRYLPTKREVSYLKECFFDYISNQSQKEGE